MLIQALRQQLEPLSLFKKALKLTLTVLFALACLSVYLLFSPMGVKCALWILSDTIPIQIQYGQIQGRLLDDIQVSDVEIQTPQVRAKAQQLSLQFDLLALLQPEKTIKALTLKGVELDFLDKETKTSSKEVRDTLLEGVPQQALPPIQATVKDALPFALQIENLDIEDATVYWHHQLFYAKKLVMLRAKSSDLDHIQEIHYEGNLGRVNAFLQDAIKIDWDLRINELPAQVKYLKGEMRSAGKIFLPKRDLDDPNNQLQMSVWVEKLQHEKHLLQKLNFDLKGNLRAHQMALKGDYEGDKFLTQIQGAVGDHLYKAKINRLTVAHPRWEKLGITHGDLLVKWDAKQVISDLSFMLWDKHPTALKAQVQLDKPYALTGSFTSSISQIKSLTPLIPDMAYVRGKLEVNLALSGNLLAPEVTGNVELTDAKVRKAFGSKATVNNLLVKLAPKQKFTLEGNGMWGSGAFHLDGSGDLNGTMPSLVLNLHGENLLLSDTPQYYVVANPDLTLSFQNGIPNLTGQIFIPQAEIQSLQNPDVISPSSDVVLVSAASKKANLKPIAERKIAHHFTSHIDIILGDKISFKGHGVQSKVNGQIQIIQQPGQPPKGKGTLNLVQGKYRGYGKVFDLQYGKIHFTGGPLVNPILDVRAQRTIQPPPSLPTASHSGQPIVVGVKLTGNVKSPTIHLYSKPSMPDVDIISYLVVGRPQNQLNEAQADLLFQAASQLTSLMGGKRNDVQFNLAEKLKLDQIGFAKKSSILRTPTRSTSIGPGPTNPLEDTMLVLGKQISDKLYLQYSVGLMDQANNLGLRYLLGKHLMIEAATGTQESSADLLLTFEGH